MGLSRIETAPLRRGGDAALLSRKVFLRSSVERKDADGGFVVNTHKQFIFYPHQSRPHPVSQKTTTKKKATISINFGKKFREEFYLLEVGN